MYGGAQKEAAKEVWSTAAVEGSTGTAAREKKTAAGKLTFASIAASLVRHPNHLQSNVTFGINAAQLCCMCLHVRAV